MIILRWRYDVKEGWRSPPWSEDHGNIHISAGGSGSIEKINKMLHNQVENHHNEKEGWRSPPWSEDHGNERKKRTSLPISEISDYFLEEFVDELAHITFPPGNDDLPFDAESDLRDIEYVLNHVPTKEMDYILKDSIDENSPNDNLVDTISEMFTDEHALDYSSPPLWDDYDDDLFYFETVNDNTYDDPFYSKEEKMKDSKLLIDELDLPGSSDFLPFPECDSVFYEDFSEVDALSSTNNEEKNSFHKEVPGLGALLSFSSENEKKVFNPGIIISKGVHTSLLPELSHQALSFQSRARLFIIPCSSLLCVVRLGIARLKPSVARDLKFVDQHNMVACLEITEENAKFHQIVDFLTTSSIHYAPTNVKGGSTAEQITTAGDTLNTASINVSTVGPSNGSAAGPSTSTTGDIFEDEMTTIADTLVAIRSARPRTTSVVIRNVEEEPRRATPVPIVQSQDKGKGKMVEPEPTPKNPRKAQIQMDEELAQRAGEQEAKDDASIEQMEDVQARMDVDELLAVRLQKQEREQFSIDEQARFLVETITARKKFFAA
ncbi:hypothetical protein Tco_1283023 [Tanacetum coccineum]